MRTFAIIRLALWSVLLGACLVVVLLYFTLANTVLDTKKLSTAAQQSDIYSTIRTDIITPRIVDAVQSTDYGTVADTAMVSSVVNQVFTDAKVETAFKPAVSSLQQWLDSKQSSVDFTLSVDTEMKDFTKALSAKVAAKIATLPACTYLNSYDDAFNGTCKTPDLAPADYEKLITASLQSNPDIEKATFSANEVNLPATIVSATSNIPDYINMLYAAAILAGGLSIAIALWLLFKKWLAGIISIGAAGLLASIALFVTTSIVSTLPNQYVLPKGYTSVAKAFIQLITEQMASFATTIGISAAIVILCASGILYLLHRRKKAAPSSEKSVTFDQ